LFLLIWSEVLAEFHALEGAMEQANKGLVLAKRGVDLAMLGWGYMCLVRILFSRGEYAGIKETIDQMESTARESYAPDWIMDQMAAWQARLWLVEGKPEAAWQWARERGLVAAGEPKPPQEPDYFTLIEYIVLARILIAQERWAEATKLLPLLLEAAEAGGRTTRVIEILNLQALAFQARADSAGAMAALERALTLAEPEGFFRTFVNEGPPMACLLEQLRRKGVAVDYITQLLAAFEDATKDQEPALSPPKGRTTDSSPLSSILRPSSPLVEPLSERELEVLQLIAEGLTNREIASRLYVSLNTVKAHTRNIYGKLDVHSRTQAIALAREVGLLSRR
jgi:LuxR family maltose regulon positive regulatory protein